MSTRHAEQKKEKLKKREWKEKKALTLIENGTDTLNSVIKLRPERSLQNSFAKGQAQPPGLIVAS